MKVIVFHNGQTLSVVRPVYALKRSGEDMSRFLERIAAGAVPAGKAWHVVEDSDFPASREFRNAWKLEGGKVVIDLEAAKAIQSQKLLAVTDRGTGAAVESLPAETEAAIEAAKTIDELKEVAWAPGS
jgi:urease accessory protein UreE